MDDSEKILQNSLTTTEKKKLKSFSILSNKFFWINLTLGSFFLLFSHKNLKLIHSRANMNLLYSMNFLGLPLAHSFLLHNQKQQFLTELRLKYKIQKLI